MITGMLIGRIGKYLFESWVEPGLQWHFSVSCLVLFSPPSSLGPRSSRGRRSLMTTLAMSKRASCIIWVSVSTESYRLHWVSFKSLCFLIPGMFLLVQERCTRCWERWTTECQRRQVFVLAAGDRLLRPTPSFSDSPVPSYFCLP